MGDIRTKYLIQTGVEDRVWSWSWWETSVGDNAVQYTAYIRPGVDAAPRMAMSNYHPRNEHPVHNDLGPFDQPERFGSWGTAKEFWEYVHNFVTTPGPDSFELAGGTIEREA